MKMKNNQENNFMKKFKYYKSTNPQPSLEKVIKLNTLNDGPTIVTSNNKEDLRVNTLGLKCCRNWTKFVFEKHPGLILIKDPFTCLGQRYWTRKCLQEYPIKPNKTNIDLERHIQDWWKECHEGDMCNKNLQKKLRWTTLGYHHNWDTKVYSEENRNAFPEELAELCDVVSIYLGYKNFRAEAAIVNYYHMGSTLSAHTDHSEVNLEAPLFSFSFGQSAIFLIGGQDKSIEPSAILINSGDIVIMSEEARLSYHAVPKILSATTQPWNNYENLTHIKENAANFVHVNESQIISEINNNIDDNIWSKFNSYIEESRININVRQVLKQNQLNLYDFDIT